MKVVGIVGSPRKNGNVNTLVNATLEGAKTAGMEAQIFHLGEMKLQGCVGCGRCKKDGICKFDDDVWSVLKAMQEADAVVLGSPIYYRQLSSQTRTLLDRSYAFFNPDFTTRWKPGKRAVIITSQELPEPDRYAGVPKELAAIFQEIDGFKVVDTITMTGANDIKAVKSRPDLIEAANKAGIKLAKP